MLSALQEAERFEVHFCFLKKMSEVRKLTTFYLTKNDHRWVTFISLKWTACRPRSSRSCASPHKRQRQPPQRALNRVLLNGHWKAAGSDLSGRGEKTATSIQKERATAAELVLEGLKKNHRRRTCFCWSDRTTAGFFFSSTPSPRPSCSHSPEPQT